MPLLRISALALGLATVGCDGEPSCEDSYEEYLSHLRARFESCGLDFGSVDTTPPEECDDDMQESLVCLDDCVSRLSCGALTGSNPSQSQGYVDCVSACPTPSY